MTLPVDPMLYYDTDDPEVIAHYRALNAAASAMYRAILYDAPKSAERTLAIRKLQEARMWANAAVALDGRPYEL